ncbi:MAG TPA: helix-turn-helix transcriptional regulator [Alphaproteobacteria bacterium]|nr:helix-turn-helix transcriptional regulator [Alphaproteobacteria bacterium]HQS84983.1 helix-turn-helix transcriptional regulator [Alphaproteobacteria bacterium]HQS93118.1 helix-turn-helix transcriptional regulator [Alphaproteobacteria bacterium]
MTSALQKKIRDHLDRTGYSIAGFEREAGLKTNVIRNILNGYSVKPTPNTLNALARAMNLSVPALLDREEKPFSRFEEDSPIIEKPELMVEALQAILRIAAEHGRKLTIYKACLMLDEVYAYTVQKKLPVIDEEFIRWFVLKTLKEMRE